MSLSTDNFFQEFILWHSFLHIQLEILHLPHNHTISSVSPSRQCSAKESEKITFGAYHSWGNGALTLCSPATCASHETVTSWRDTVFCNVQTGGVEKKMVFKLLTLKLAQT